MPRYHNKDIKMLVAFLPTLKMFLSVEINSEVMEAAARSCYLKKVIVKNFEKFAKTSAGVSVLKNKTKREKQETLAQNPSFEGCQRMAASEGIIQNDPSKFHKFSRQASALGNRYN